jgi:hypothetical protein
VIQPEGEPEVLPEDMTAAVPASGSMVNSGPLSGTPESRAFDCAVAHVEKLGVGQRAVNYRLRDWLISRQRYWGAPIPMVYCPELRCSAGARRSTARSAARRCGMEADRRKPAEAASYLALYNLPGLRRASGARYGHDGHLYVFVLVSPALFEPTV